MKTLLSWLVVVLLAGTTALRASEFDWIARSVERESGCKQTHIPFFGLARFIVGVAHPAGASELRLAIFEKPDMPAARFSSIVDDAVGASWKPVIRVRSRNRESTSIYVQEDGKRMRLLIGTLDQSDATLVQVKVDVGRLMELIDDARCHKTNGRSSIF